MSKFIDTEVIRARAADLRAIRYNCECQVGGVDAASVDADYLHSIGEQIDALLDALARAKAEGYDEGANSLVTWLAHDLQGPSPANRYRADRIDPTEGTRG